MGEPEIPSRRAAVEAPGSSLFIFALLVALATLAVFSPALRCDFVNWDDNHTILGNFHFRGFGFTQLRWMFTTFYLGPYQPLSWLSYALDYRLWGLNPAGYHFTNNLLHAANSVAFLFLAFGLLRHALGGKVRASNLAMGAAFGALIFSLHPLRVESVAWVTERRDVLSGFFWLVALLCYVRSTEAAAARMRWLALSVGSYALSQLSKAVGVTFPVLLLILDVYPLERLPRDPREWLSPRWRPILIEKTPYAGLALLGAAFALFGQLHANAAATLDQFGFFPRIGQAIYGLGFYLWKTLVPLRLAPLYVPPASMWELTVPLVCSAIVVFALTVAAFRVRKARPVWLAAWLYYVISLLPVLGLVRIGHILAADRYSYLSCLVWALLAGAGLSIALEKARAAIRGVLLFAAAALVTVLGSLTWAQTQVWTTSETLWRQVIAIDPTIRTAHVNLGNYLADHQRYSEAAEEYATVLRLHPIHAAGLHTDWGIMLARQNRPAEALEEFSKALRETPDYFDAHDYLCAYLPRLGRGQEAVAHCEEALRQDPDLPQAREIIQKFSR